MLDFLGVRKQITQFMSRRQDRTARYKEAYGQAANLLEKYDREFERLNEMVRIARLPILTAGFSSALTTAINSMQRPAVCTVSAVDGSQIYPDRHEISPCYLINIGKIRFDYGTANRPVMESTPRVYDLDEPFLDESILGIPMSHDLVNARRTLMEMEALCEMCVGDVKSRSPVLGLTDGTLILWHLEALAQPVKQFILKRFLEHLDALEKAGRPVAGYISFPGSSDVTNALRIACLVESGASPGDLKSSNGQATSIQSVLPGVTDRGLFGSLLKTGQRSGLFSSNSRILDEYGTHKVWFFYIHTGLEIARVEIPAWVAADSNRVSFVHSMVVDQVEKGSGYPISLAEAHERAVVRGADRSLFFDILSRAFAREGIRVRRSAKVARKTFLGI